MAASVVPPAQAGRVRRPGPRRWRIPEACRKQVLGPAGRAIRGSSGNGGGL